MAAPTIHVQRFWTAFKPDPADAGKLIPIDMCAYGPIGQLQRSLTITEVKRLAAVRQEDGNNDSAIGMARARWDMIRPQYEAWKSGQEMPLNGTPLAAWNAVTPEQAEVFKSRGVRTVEDIAGLTDAAIEGIPVPRLRDLKKSAHLFLDSAETAKFASVLAEKERQIENNAAELLDSKKQIADLMSKVNQLAEMIADKQSDDEAPAKRGPGRPAKAA